MTVEQKQTLFNNYVHKESNQFKSLPFVKDSELIPMQRIHKEIFTCFSLSGSGQRFLL